MPSAPFFFSWELASDPLDDAELRLYQALKEQRFGDYFYIKVRVRHQMCFTQQPQRQRQQQPHSITAPFDSFSTEGWMLLPTQEFLENGPSHIQLNFPYLFIPNELVQDMMPKVIAHANAMLRYCNSRPHNQRPNFRFFSLALNIIVQRLYYEDDDDDVTNMIMRESMEDINMVPASKTAIESLNKVKLESRDTNTIERCSICLTEFDGDADEVSSMPCKHVYHQECIMQWLKTSHMCPLCRYPMPI